MDEKDVLRIGTEAVVKPFGDIISRLLGPASDEIGAAWGLYWRAYRMQKAISVFVKLQRIASSAGIDLGPVHPKLFFDIMHNATLEDDEDLHTYWANLLANASDVRGLVDVLPSFPDILHQLSKTEAIFLNALYNSVEPRMPRAFPDAAPSPRWALTVDLGLWHRLMTIFADAGLTKNPGSALVTLGDVPAKDAEDADHSAFMIASDGLLRANLLLRVPVTKITPGAVAKPSVFGTDLRAEDHYRMTALGFQFVTACRSPRPSGT